MQHGRLIKTALGEKYTDSNGAAVGAVRINPAQGYRRVPMLLKEYIDSGSRKAWEEIRQIVDNVYLAVSCAMESLDAEEPFSKEIAGIVESGKKLLIKPNMVALPSIDPQTHEPMFMGTCTQWEVTAAVMRWFHDKCDISYNQMAMAEGGNTTTSEVVLVSRILGENVTTQALMEGKIGGHYGGGVFIL
jgi:hypothetical protein